MTARSSAVLDVVGTLLRLGMAAVWLVSGALKAADPDQTYVAVRAYDVLPRGLVDVVAAVLPWFELGLGVLLLLGVATRLVAVLSIGLLVLFIAGVGQAWVRGLSIDCGCFGGGGQVAPDATSYGVEIARDVGFLAIAVSLAVRPRSLLAIDRLLASWDSARLAKEGR